MSQHSKEQMMHIEYLLNHKGFQLTDMILWKLVNEKLIQTIHTTRVKFRTNVSQSILDYLSTLAKENDTHINYLLEIGLQNLLADGVIAYNKESRPKKSLQYKTTYDQELLKMVKEFAKQNHLFINDVIEYSTKLINFKNITNK